jgi:hypothetical protein
MALMRLLSGERGYLVVDRDVREALTRELESSNPDTSLFRAFNDRMVSVSPDALAVADPGSVRSDDARIAPAAMDSRMAGSPRPSANSGLAAPGAPARGRGLGIPPSAAASAAIPVAGMPLPPAPSPSRAAGSPSRPRSCHRPSHSHLLDRPHRSGSRRATRRRHRTPPVDGRLASPGMAARCPPQDRWASAAVSRIHRGWTWLHLAARSPPPRSVDVAATAAEPSPTDGRSPSAHTAGRISPSSNAPRAVRSSSSAGSSVRPADEVWPKREASRRCGDDCRRRHRVRRRCT